MPDSRKYLMECQTVRPSGVTAITATTVYNLTDAFSGTTFIAPIENYSYDEITLFELGVISDVDYEERVNHFVQYVHSLAQFDYELDDITTLINNGQVDDPINCV